jgi:hypothetical protein
MFLLCLEFMSVPVCLTCLRLWADILQERSGKAQSQCWLLSVFHVGQTLSEHLTDVMQLLCTLCSVIIHATCVSLQGQLHILLSTSVHEILSWQSAYQHNMSWLNTD